MNILKNIIAVIVGYAVFAVSAVLLFKLSGVDPHSDPSTGFILLTIAYGLLFSFLGGMLTQLISGSRKLAINFVLAGIMAAFAAFSLFKTSGNHFTQIAAIFLFAPASISGGWMWLRFKR